MVVDILGSREEIQAFLGIEPLQSVSIRLTRSCNLRCKQCYSFSAKALPDELSAAEYRRIFGELRLLGVLRIFFTGGEPFLRADTAEILRDANTEGFAVYISSNGTCLDEAVFGQLAKLDHLRSFQISLDGLEHTHDRIRGANGTFQKAVRTLKEGCKLLHTPLKVAVCTLLPENVREILELVDVVEDTGADAFCLVPLYPIKRSAELQDLETEEKSRIFECLAARPHSKTKIGILAPPALIPKALRSRELGCGYICSFPSILGIDSNGDVAPCDGLLSRDEFRLGNVRHAGLRSLWDHPTMLKLRDISCSNLTGVCKRCCHLKFCVGGCRARAYLEYKDFHAPNPLCQSFYDKGLFPPELLLSD